jgi:hypothetical protein
MACPPKSTGVRSTSELSLESTNVSLIIYSNCSIRVSQDDWEVWDSNQKTLALVHARPFPPLTARNRSPFPYVHKGIRKKAFQFTTLRLTSIPISSDLQRARIKGSTG